jgi:hypothetical protein
MIDSVNLSHRASWAGRELRGMLSYLRRRLGPDHPHTRAAAAQADPGR